jgi:hypothetical protein
MKSLVLVEPMYIHQVWDMVAKFLQASYDSSTKDCTPDQLKSILARGEQHMFVVRDNNIIIGAFTVCVYNVPNAKIAFTTAMGGKALLDKETISQYEAWARSQGVTKLRANAKDAQARLFQQKLGLIKISNVVEKDL